MFATSTKSILVRLLVLLRIDTLYIGVVRPLLPSVFRKLSNVPTPHQRKVGDNWLPRSWGVAQPDIPDYEQTLVRALHRSVEPGDRVINIGGGEGVVSVVSARLTGPSGSVVCYEGSLEQVTIIRETIAINRLSNISIVHAVIGSAIGVYGPQDEYGDVVQPEQLPECDVLEMDCEGAELQILRGLRIRPRAILVETHGMYGATVEVVSNCLRGLGYSVQDLGYAEPRSIDSCIENEVKILIGRRSHNS